MLVRCSAIGCDQAFSTESSVSPGACFLCRNHTPKMLMEDAPRFQDTQFDTFHLSRTSCAVVLIDGKNKETESDPLNPTKRKIEAAPRGQ